MTQAADSLRFYTHKTNAQMSQILMKLRRPSEEQVSVEE